MYADERTTNGCDRSLWLDQFDPYYIHDLPFIIKNPQKASIYYRYRVCMKHPWSTVAELAHPLAAPPKSLEPHGLLETSLQRDTHTGNRHRQLISRCHAPFQLIRLSLTPLINSYHIKYSIPYMCLRNGYVANILPICIIECGGAFNCGNVRLCEQTSPLLSLCCLIVQ